MFTYTTSEDSNQQICPDLVQMLPASVIAQNRFYTVRNNKIQVAFSNTAPLIVICQLTTMEITHAVDLR